jgi:SAM-dependent methyltransferase
VFQKISFNDVKDLRYADFGCSTGYLTNIVAKMVRPSSTFGFDHYLDHLQLAKQKYTGYRFDFVDLNKSFNVGKFDIVTCFETLEHVGNQNTAINNLLNATEKGGMLVITVPIEIGFIGLLKFLTKTALFGYKLDELSKNDLTFFKYLFHLMTYKDISSFREERKGWGTHFGFDYRTIDLYLHSLGVPFKTKSVVTTKFIVITP